MTWNSASALPLIARCCVVRYSLKNGASWRKSKARDAEVQQRWQTALNPRFPNQGSQNKREVESVLTENAPPVEQVCEKEMSEGWTQVMGEGGQPYYYNEATGETSWEPPAAMGQLVEAGNGGGGGDAGMNAAGETVAELEAGGGAGGGSDDGFDGAGDDGGSCIDGRLTSCWNWCSKLENKKCV